MRGDQRIRRRPSRTGGGRFKIKQQTIASQQAELLKLIRAREGLSRIDLSRIMNLAPSTVGIYVDHLVGEGFLFEGKARERDFGRPPTILGLNPQGGRFIGVDFEARSIRAVAVDFSQKPVNRYHAAISSDDSVDAILRKIEHAIESVGAGDDRKILGVGVGVPGLIDSERGVALEYRHIHGWRDVPLVERLYARFNVPLFLENNIRTMALAELWFGQGRGLRNFICVGIRSGIAAGIIVEGQLLKGAGNRAGEIGDWPCTITRNAQTTSPAMRRLEEIVSVEALQQALPKTLAGNVEDSLESAVADFQGALAAGRAGDERVLKALREITLPLAAALAQLQLTFDPAKIILAGRFTSLEEVFLDQLREHLKTLAPSTAMPVIVNSTLGDFNGAVGAAALAVHQWKPSAVD